MDDSRKEQLRRINPNRVQSNGIYVVTDRKGKRKSIKLTIDDIRYLRWYHRDNSIASKIVVPTNKDKQPSANVSTKPPGKKNMNLTKSQKYNKGYRILEPIKVVGKYVVIFGVVVCIGVSMFKFVINPKPEPEPSGAYITMSEDFEGGYMGEPEAPEEELDEDYIKQVERADFIRMLCQINQSDYQTTYSKLVELTDDFTDSEYLAGRHPLVSCKGFPVDADSEEEFLVYAVRVIAQDPERVGLTRSQVCINNGYTSSTDYNGIIAKWSPIIDVDPALIYGIIQAETSWNSEMFIEDNNPAGLKNGGRFWKFPNKEAGIIELMLEVVKYRYKGATTIEEISKIHCPIGDPDDVNGLNRNWVKNVTAGYEQGREIFEAMGFYKNNGLSY